MATQYMWKELCAQISELADATATENAELIASKEQLQAELQELKRTIAAAPASQRVVASNTSIPPNGPPLALCVVDGWRTSFTMRFVKQGEAGGRAAGQHLVGELYKALGVPPGIADNQHPVWTSVFLSSRALITRLVKQGTGTADEVEGFVKGLGQAHKSLVLVDVSSKMDADDKMRTYLATFSSLPQVTRVFFAGGRASPFASVARDEVTRNKLVFLRNKGTASPPSMDPNVPVLNLEDMLEEVSIYDATNTNMTVSPGSYAASVSASGPTPPLFSPSLHTGSTTRAFGSRDGMMRPPASQTSGEEKPLPTLDPTLSLNKQINPPCYHHYLLGNCIHGDACTYEHRYELSDRQISELRRLAKQQPCAHAVQGQTCAYGQECVYGHECPFGLARCRYVLDDKCRFSKGMHK